MGFRKALWSAVLLVPGLALTGGITAAAYVLSALPGLKVMGALGIALFLGLAVRAALGLPDGVRAGTAFSAKTLLRLGIVLLGVRLNFALISDAGPTVLLLDLLVISAGILFVERLGSFLGMSRGLRLSLAVGTSICGASAIAAASPVVRADEDEVSVSVGIVSVLGTLGVLAYTLIGTALHADATAYALMAGSTLQEVGQAIAAGFALGPQAGDLATVTKLTRVALLAPVLLVIGAILARRERSAAGEDRGDPTAAVPPSTQAANAEAARPPLVPPFLAGFLLVGLANTLGWIPLGVAGRMQSASLILTAAAMAGIGLGVHLGVLRRIGGKSLMLGAAGFAVLVVLSAAYTALLAG